MNGSLKEKILVSKNLLTRHTILLSNLVASRGKRETGGFVHRNRYYEKLVFCGNTIINFK